MKQRLPQRQHHAHVQQALPVILQHAEQAGGEDHHEIDTARHIEASHARPSVQCGIEQDAIDDEPDEQRLDHL
jgi:glycine/D-amino acid oxidase-like deaminating enzyme